MSLTLQLADRAPKMGEDLSYFMRIPDGRGGTMLVREDAFDDLPVEARAVIYDQYGEDPNMGFLWFGKKAKARREERRTGRQERKIEKIGARGQARATARGGGESVWQKFGGAAGSVVGALIPGGGGPEQPGPFEPGGAYQMDPYTVAPEKKWFQTTGGMIGLGLGGLLLVGGTVYLIKKGKKK